MHARRYFVKAQRIAGCGTCARFHTPDPLHLLLSPTGKATSFVLSRARRRARIDRMETAGTLPARTRLKPSGRTSCSLTSSQQMMVDAHASDARNAILMPRTQLLFEGALDQDVLARCLDEIYARNTILSTRVIEVDGRFRQFVPTERPSLDVELLSFEDTPEEQHAARWKELMDQLGAPFDLGRGQLIRAAVVKLGGNRHVGVLTAHHVAFDRGSVSGLLAELRAGYTALATNTAWPEQPLQYIDLASYLEALPGTEIGKKSVAFWEQNLAGAEPLALPVDHSRARVDARRDAVPHGVAVFPIGGDVTAAVLAPLHDEIASLARTEGVSRFIVLIAGLVANLHRASQQDDITIQSTFSLRGKLALPNMIGTVSTPLLMRVEAAGDLTFRQLITRTRDTVFTSWSHAEGLRLERAPHGLRRFNFNYIPAQQGVRYEGEFAPGIAVSHMRRSWDLSQMAIAADLHLWLRETQDRTSLQLLYQSELFERPTVERFLRSYLEVLSEMCANPDAKITLCS